MPSPYSSCGFLGFGRTTFDKAQVCGDDTAFRDDKCVSIGKSKICTEIDELI